MSATALQYVKELGQSPEARAVTSAEWLVLRALALMHNPQVDCAFAPVAKVAAESMMSERHARRMLGKLEGRGLVLRLYTARDHDGSQATNEYVLPGMQAWLDALEVDEADIPMGRGTAGAQARRQVSTASVQQQDANTAEARDARRQVFKVPRTRIEAQRQLAVVEPRPNPLRVGSAAVDCALPCPPPGGQQVSGGGGQQVSPRDVVFEVVLEEEPTPAPTLTAGNLEKPVQPDDAKGESAQATATADAAARARRSAEVPAGSRARRSVSLARAREAGAASRNQAGLSQAGLSLPGGFEREPGGAEDREAQLRGAATRVLMACGIAPDSSTRRLRAAVEEALRLRCEQTRVRDEPGSLDDAVRLAMKRWQEYTDFAGKGLLLYVVGVRKFFAGGIWLQPEIWPIDRRQAARGRLI